MTDSEEIRGDIARVALLDTEFEAHTKASLLIAGGIETRVICEAPSWTGQMAISNTAKGAGVWVHRDDLEEARSILKQNAVDSVDLDWDEVDVGEREDQLPLKESPGIPLAAKLGFAVAALILMMLLFGFLMNVLSLFS